MLKKIQKGKIKLLWYFRCMIQAISTFSDRNQSQAKQFDRINEGLNVEEYYTYHGQQGFNASFQTDAF